MAMGLRRGIPTRRISLKRLIAWWRVELLCKRLPLQMLHMPWVKQTPKPETTYFCIYLAFSSLWNACPGALEVWSSFSCEMTWLDFSHNLKWPWSNKGGCTMFAPMNLNLHSDQLAPEQAWLAIDVMLLFLWLLTWLQTFIRATWNKQLNKDIWCKCVGMSRYYTACVCIALSCLMNIPPIKTRIIKKEPWQSHSWRAKKKSTHRTHVHSHANENI